MAKSSNPPAILITKIKEAGKVPAFVALGHRHLEKAPPIVVRPTEVNEFIVPVDLLRVTGVPEDALAGITEITLGYQKR